MEISGYAVVVGAKVWKNRVELFHPNVVAPTAGSSSMDGTCDFEVLL